MRSQLLAQAPDDPPIPFRPGEHGTLVNIPAPEVMETGPCGNIAIVTAVVITAGVVHVPVKGRRIQSPAVEKVADADGIEFQKVFILAAQLHRNGKGVPRSIAVDNLPETLKVLVIVF